MDDEKDLELDKEIGSNLSLPTEHTEVNETEVMAEPLLQQTPQTALTFLIVSGRRRTMQFDPGTAIARVKELVWDGWPSDWQEERPPTPSYLRIIYLGKILQDDDTLSQIGFPSALQPPSGETPKQCTIVHLSVKLVVPPPADDEDQLKKRIKARARRALSGSTPAAVGVVAPNERAAGGGAPTATGGNVPAGRTGAQRSPPSAPNAESAGGCCGCVIC